MRILSGNNIDRAEWSKLVGSSATGTWFQGPEAYDFFVSMPELFRPFAYGIEAEGRLRAVCVGYITVEKSSLKQFFTRRAIIIGGPCLAEDASSEEVGLLMNGVKELMSERINGAPIYIESRNFNDYSRWKSAFATAGFEYKKHLNFHVDCRDKEAMWERLSENRKRQIKKQPTQTLPEGRAYMDVTEAEIREWYEILRELYRTKVKTPLWPVEFFLEAYRQGIGKFLLVKHEGKIIGGSMVASKLPSLQGEELRSIERPVDGHRTSEERLVGGTVYEWFECGMNAEYKEQYPSVMATWAGMELGHETGCARYDMMGAGEPSIPYGVRDFKSEFGGELVEHGRFLCVNKPVMYQIGKFGIWLLKRIE